VLLKGSLQTSLTWLKHSRDGKQIFFLTRQDGGRIWAIPVAGGSIRVAVDLEGRPGRLGGQALAISSNEIFFS